MQVSTWITIDPESEEAQSNDVVFQKTLRDEALLKYLTFTGANQPDYVEVEDWYEVD